LSATADRRRSLQPLSAKNNKMNIPKTLSSIFSIPFALFNGMVLGILIGLVLVAIFNISSFEGGSAYFCELVGIITAIISMPVYIHINYKYVNKWIHLYYSLLVETTLALMFYLCFRII